MLYEVITFPFVKGNGVNAVILVRSLGHGKEEALVYCHGQGIALREPRVLSEQMKTAGNFDSYFWFRLVFTGMYGHNFV